MKNNIKKYINIILFLLIIFILYLLLGKNNIKENFKLTSNKYIIITTSLIERNFEERKTSTTVSYVQKTNKSLEFGIYS